MFAGRECGGGKCEEKNGTGKGKVWKVDAGHLGE